MKPANVRLESGQIGHTKLSLAPCPPAPSSILSNSPLKERRMDNGVQSRSGEGRGARNPSVFDHPSTRQVDDTSHPSSQEDQSTMRNHLDTNRFSQDELIDLTHSSDVDIVEDVLAGQGGRDEEDDIFAYGLHNVNLNSEEMATAGNGAQFDLFESRAARGGSQERNLQLQHQQYENQESFYNHPLPTYESEQEQSQNYHQTEQEPSQAMEFEPYDPSPFHQSRPQNQSVESSMPLDFFNTVAIAKSPLKLALSKHFPSSLRSVPENQRSSSFSSNRPSSQSRTRTSLHPLTSRDDTQEGRRIKEEQDLASRMEIESEGVKAEEWGTLWMGGKTGVSIRAANSASSASDFQSTKGASSSRKPFKSLLLPGLHAQSNIPATPIRGSLLASGKGKKFRLPMFSTPMQINANEGRRREIQLEAARRERAGQSQGKKRANDELLDKENEREASQLASTKEIEYNSEDFVPADRIRESPREESVKPRKKMKLTLFEPSPPKRPSSAASIPTIRKLNQLSPNLKASNGKSSGQEERERDEQVDGISRAQNVELSASTFLESVSDKETLTQRPISQSEPQPSSLNLYQPFSRQSPTISDSIANASHQSSFSAIYTPTVQFKPDFEANVKDWEQLFSRSRSRFHFNQLARDFDVGSNSTIGSDGGLKNGAGSSNGFSDDEDEVENEDGMRERQEKIKEVDPYQLSAHREIISSLSLFSVPDGDLSSGLNREHIKMKAGIDMMAKVEKMVANL